MSWPSSTRIALLCASFLTAACGVERATAPDAGTALSAAIASGTPTSLSASPASGVQINLSWSDNSPNETGFEVHRSSNGAAGTFALVATVRANVTGLSDPGRAPLTEYCYKVRVVRALGNGKNVTYSDFSNVACATTYGPPAVPANVTATSMYWGVITVAWSPPPTALGYRVQRSPTGADPWELIATTDASTTTYSDGGHATEAQNCYRVIAYNNWGDSPPSSTVCSAVLASPSNLAATAGAAGGVDLSWSDNSRYEDGYEVQRSGSDGVSTVVASLPVNTISYHDAPAAPGRYWYRIRAKKGGSYSYFSDYADALVASAPPSAPTNVRALATSSSSVAVYWQDMSADEQGFRVERSTDGRVTWTTAGTANWNQSELDEADRTAEQEVCYRVIAFNNAGNSPASNEDCTVPPAAPTELVATAVGSDAIDLSWSDNSGVEDGYDILRMYCYQDWYSGEWICGYSAIATVGRNATSYRDTGLNPSEDYMYVVVAFKVKGDLRGGSDWSNEASATTNPAPE
jgi:hypothetical protein